MKNILPRKTSLLIFTLFCLFTAGMLASERWLYMATGGMLIVILWDGVVFSLMVKPAKLSVVRELPQTPYYVIGSRFEYFIHLINNTRYRMKISLLDVITGDFRNILSSFKVVIPPGNDHREAMSFEIENIGLLEFSGIFIRIFSPIGFFSTERFIESREKRIVVPDISLSRTLGKLGFHRGITGMNLIRQRGMGSELREIREYTYGDSFKYIAWKNTARLGKLMTREYEDEIPVTLIGVLDVSLTMKLGVPGKRKIDLSFEILDALVKVFLRSKDRVSLSLFDEAEMEEICPSNKGNLYLDFVRVYRKFLEREVKSGNKTMQFKQALKNSLKEVKGATMLVILSDMEEVAMEPILKILKVFEKKYCRIFLVSPFAPWFEKEIKVEELGETEKMLLQIHLRRYREMVEDISKELRRTRINFLLVSPEEAVQVILLKLLREKRLVSSA